MIKQAFLQAGVLVRTFVGRCHQIYRRKKHSGPNLLFIDFEKAFDTLEWFCISKTHQHFVFGPSLLNWIKLFFIAILKAKLKSLRVQ